MNCDPAAAVIPNLLHTLFNAALALPGTELQSPCDCRLAALWSYCPRWTSPIPSWVSHRDPGQEEIPFSNLATADGCGNRTTTSISRIVPTNAHQRPLATSGWAWWTRSAAWQHCYKLSTSKAEAVPKSSIKEGTRQECSPSTLTLEAATKVTIPHALEPALEKRLASMKKKNSKLSITVRASHWCLWRCSAAPAFLATLHHPIQPPPATNSHCWSLQFILRFPCTKNDAPRTSTTLG